MAETRDADERNLLIDSASTVLARSGWWGFKVSSVLRQARMSTRSFYRQFDTKDELLAALWERDLLRIADTVDGIIDPSAPVDQRIWQYVGTLVTRGLDGDFAKPATLFATAFRGLRPQHSEPMDRCLAALTAPLVEVLAEGGREGVITVTDPAGDARIVLALIGTALFDGPGIGADGIRQHIEVSVVPFIARSFGIDPPASGLATP
ncbi:TetR/AcrR family transcriptional regulator [Mycobacterium sp. NBC_00419]|uniref:TetR/AcrR family transcriptional regulator n=1 Tax=Mycobacterium sp. NBC_00419 TaxID=2975989 RepID=UPI002E1BEF10